MAIRKNTGQWTKEDLEDFFAFIRSKGGVVLEYSALMHGGYEFTIQRPTKSQPNWAFERMKEFDAKR